MFLCTDNSIFLIGFFRYEFCNQMSNNADKIANAKIYIGIIFIALMHSEFF